jgi:hypothetical protein
MCSDLAVAVHIAKRAAAVLTNSTRLEELYYNTEESIGTQFIKTLIYTASGNNQ